MGVKEAIKNFGKRGRERKELLNQMDTQLRMQKIVEDRQLSSNERELNKLRNEEREEFIKEELEMARKRRDDDIRFNHNPLDVKNITAHTEWEILREKNQFAQRGNIFQGTESIIKNNPNLLKTNQKLLQTNQKLLKGGSIFKV
jgi:hypothetical protein